MTSPVLLKPLSPPDAVKIFIEARIKARLTSRSLSRREKHERKKEKSFRSNQLYQLLDNWTQGIRGTLYRLAAGGCTTVSRSIHPSYLKQVKRSRTPTDSKQLAPPQLHAALRRQRTLHRHGIVSVSSLRILDALQWSCQSHTAVQSSTGQEREGKAHQVSSSYTNNHSVTTPPVLILRVRYTATPLETVERAS